MGDDPPYLQVGTEVSAKYKGAFCEAKIRKVVRVVKCKVTFKAGLGSANLSDDNIKGELRVGTVVEAKHADKNQFVEATINKIQDCSQYTVVFDDGDITTLRRSALCLKSGRHFNESETLDQLPLTHPEHFSNPVVGGRRGVRRRAANNEDNDNESSEDEDSSPTKKGQKKTNKEADQGKVVCVESTDKKKAKDNWFPALIVCPSAQETVKIRTKDEYLVRSFRDGRYYTVPKKEITGFTKDTANKSENTSNLFKAACEKAVQFLEKNVLPPHWDRDILFGHSNASNSEEVISDSESEDDQRENKDRFVAQLFKFMDERGTPINKVPTVCGKDLDMYKLYKIVTSKGGYNKVTNSSQWKPVTMKMGYGIMPTTSTINLVKQAYKKFLHNFEEFYRKLGCSYSSLSSKPPSTQAGKSRSNRSIFRERERHASSSAGKKDEPKIDKEEDEKDKKSVTPAPSGTASATPSEIDAETESLIEGESATEEPRRSRSRLESRGKKDFDEISEKADKPSVGKNKRGSKKKEAANTSTVSASELKEREREEAQTPVSASPSPAPSSTGGKRGRGKYKKRDKQQPPPQQQQQPLQEPEEHENRSEPEESHDHIGKNVKIDLGDKLQVYYGPKSKGNVTYEAKVIDVDEAGVKYLVHYTGWNTRYDEWIDRYRIASSVNQKDQAGGSCTPDLDSMSTSSPAGSITKSTPKVPKKKGRPAGVGSGGPPQNSSGGPAKGKVGARKRLTSESEKTKGRRSRKKSGQESFTQSGSESEQDQDVGDSSDSEEKQRLISTPPSSVSSTASSARTSNKTSGGRKRKIMLVIAPEDDDASSASSSTTESSTGKSTKPDSGPPDEGNSNRDNSSTSVVLPGFAGVTANENQNQVIDLNKIRSEMKGLDKMVKVATSVAASVSSHQPSASSVPSISVSPVQSSTSVSSFSAVSSPLPQATATAPEAIPTTSVPPVTTLPSQPSHSAGADNELDVYEFQDDANDAPKLKMFAPRSPDKKEESFCMKTGAHNEGEKSSVKSTEDLPKQHASGSSAVASLVSTANLGVSIIVPNPVVNPALPLSAESPTPTFKSSSPTVSGKEDTVKSSKEIKKDSHAKEKARKEKESKESSKLPSAISDSSTSVTPIVKGGKHFLPVKPSPSMSSSTVTTFDRLSHQHPVKASIQGSGTKVPAGSAAPVLQATTIIETKSNLKMQNPVLHIPQQPPRQRAVISSYPPPLIPSGATKVVPVQIQPRSSTLSPPMPSLIQRPVIPSLVASSTPISTSAIAGLPLVTPQLHPQIQHLRPVAPPTSTVINIPSVVSGEQPSTIQINVSSASTLPLPPTPTLHPASAIAATCTPVNAVLQKSSDSKPGMPFANRQQELFPHLVQQHQQQQQPHPQPLLKSNYLPLPKIAPLINPNQSQAAAVSVITPNQSTSTTVNVSGTNKELQTKNPILNFNQNPHGLPVSLGVISTQSPSPFAVNPIISPKKSPVKRKQPSKEKNRTLNPGVNPLNTGQNSVIQSLGANLPPKKKPRKVITKNIIDIHKNEVEPVGGHVQGHGHGPMSISVPTIGPNKDDHNSGADSPTKKARKPAKKRIKIDSEMALANSIGGSGGIIGVGDKLPKPAKSPKKKPNKIDFPAPPQLLPSKSFTKSQSNIRYLSHTATSSPNLSFGIGHNTMSTPVSFVSTTATTTISGIPDKPGNSTPLSTQESVIKSAVYIKPPELQSAHSKTMAMKPVTMGSLSGPVLGVLKTPDKKSYSPKMSAATAARITSCIDSVVKVPPGPDPHTKSVLTIQPAKSSPASTPPTASAPSGHTAMTTTTFVKIPGKFEPEPIVITTVTTSPPASQSVASKPVTVIPAMAQKAVSGISTVQTTINIPSSNSKSTEAINSKTSSVLTALPSSLILSPHGGSDAGVRSMKPIMVVPISKDSLSMPQQTTLPVILKTEIKEEKPKGLGLDVEVSSAPVPVPVLFVKKNPVTIQDPSSASSVGQGPSMNSKISSSCSNNSTSVLSIKVSSGGGEVEKMKIITEDPNVSFIPVVSIKEAGDPAPMDMIEKVKVESGTSGAKDEDESCHSLLCEEEIPGSPPPGTDSSLFGIDDENARISLSSPKESPKLPVTATSTNSSTGSTSILSSMQIQYNSASGSASSSAFTSVSGAGLHPMDKGAEKSEKKSDEMLFGMSIMSKQAGSSSSAGPSSSDNLNLLQKHRDVGKAAQSLLSLADRPAANSSGQGHNHNQNQNQPPIQQHQMAFPNTHNQNLQNVMDNTPPTTPESSSISSGSPRVEGGRVSPTHDHPSSSKSNSKDSSDADSNDHKINEITEEGSSSDAGRKSLKGASSSPQKKRHVEASRSLRNSSPPSKRRRIQRRKSPDEIIRSYGYRGRGSAGGRKSNSEKDHDHGRILPPPPPINLTRPPASRKFNLIPDLDDEMESETRIQVLQLALQSIKEKYQEVKSELSSEERRLKRFKRRQKEREKEKSRSFQKTT